MYDPWKLGGAKSFLFRDLGGLSPPSPYVEPPLLVVNNFIYPALQLPPISASIGDQYDFKPTESTTAAVIDMFQNLSNLLKDDDYVVLISMDFSRAFDTVRHSTLMPKILPIDIPHSIFNCLVNYFADHGHASKLWDII